MKLWFILSLGLAIGEIMALILFFFLRGRSMNENEVVNQEIQSLRELLKLKEEKIEEMKEELRKLKIPAYLRRTDFCPKLPPPSFW